MITGVDAKTLYDGQIKKKKRNSLHYCVKHLKMINIRPIQLVGKYV